MAKRLPDPSLPWPIIMSGVALLCDSEDCQRVFAPGMLRSYPDPISGGKPWTWGWGETVGITPETIGTFAEADARLCKELTEAASIVKGLCTMPPDQHELAALISLGYNIGWAGLKRSTVLRLHNANQKAAAARAFSLWNKAHDGTGKLIEVEGLTTRRLREAAFYLTLDDGEPRPDMPQAVAPESHPAASPMTQAGVVTAAGGALTMAATVIDQVKGIASQLSDLAHSFGASPQFVLGLGLVGAGGVVVYWRRKQRLGGWA